MKEYFDGKKVGYDDAISGVIADQHFHIGGMKDPNYTMMLTTKNSTLKRIGSEIKWRINGEAVQFNYLEIVWNQYNHQNDIDDHDNHQKYPIRI